MEEITINFTEINKMECVDKSFKLAYTDLKDIVEALECYKSVLEKKAEDIANNETIDYRFKATCETKARKAGKIAEKIKMEIKYCAKCGKGRKEREKTGLSGLEALVNKQINE